MRIGIQIWSLICLSVQIFILLSALSCSGGAHPAENEFILSEERRIDWDPGISGGIPFYPAGVYVADFGALPDDGSDDSAAFQAAVNACQDGRAVIIPQGVYNLSATIDILGRSIVLRGAGFTNTRLVFSNTGNCIEIHEWSPSVSNKVTGMALKGSRIIEVDDSSQYAAGDVVMIDQENDAAEMAYGFYGTNGWDTWRHRSAGQVVGLTGAGGGRLYLDRPLYKDYNPGCDVRVYRLNIVKGAGIEDLFIEKATSGAGHNIRFVYAYGCWVKNVWSELCKNGHVVFVKSRSCVVRDSVFNAAHSTTGGGNGYGVEVRDKSSDNLVENNIFVRLRHSMDIEAGANGNVFGYNYSRRPYNEDDTDFLMHDICVHGNYAYMNLFEGNEAEHGVCDNVWGSNAWNTFFRNVFAAHTEGLRSSHAFEVEENNGSQNFIGNIFGHAGLSAGLYINPGEPDIFIHGNMDGYSGRVEWQADYGRNLPASLYLRVRPPWFTPGKPWPLTGPDTAEGQALPARDRWMELTNQGWPGRPE